jgi:hypothetical protein
MVNYDLIKLAIWVKMHSMEPMMLLPIRIASTTFSIQLHFQMKCLNATCYKKCLELSQHITCVFCSSLLNKYEDLNMFVEFVFGLEKLSKF